MNTRATAVSFASPELSADAQPRTMPERLIDGIINVKEYGATGDGVTDDRAAIQSAIDNGVRNNCGIIFFPPGTYLVGASLLLPITTHRYFRFVGCGADLEAGTGSIITAAMSSYILYCRHGTTGFVSIEGIGFVNLGTNPPLNSEPKNSADIGYVVSGTASGSGGNVRLIASSMDLTYQYSFIFMDGDSVDVSGVGGTTEANGTWTIGSPNLSLIPWTPITQSSASAGGSGGTNTRVNYYGATGLKVGDSLIISGMGNWSYSISGTTNSGGNVRIAADDQSFHAGESVSIDGVLNADNVTANEANGTHTVLSTGSGFIVINVSFSNTGHGGSIVPLTANETNGTQTITAVSLTGVWNTGWFEIGVVWKRQGAGGMTRGKWIDLRGTTYSHAWTSGGEWHYNGFAGGCIYTGAGVGTSIRDCSFQVDKGICLFYQNIDGFVSGCHFKGTFGAADIHAITSTSSGTGGVVRLAVASSAGIAAGNRVIVWGVSPAANEANGDYYGVTAVGSGWIEIGATYASAGTGGYIALLSSVGFFNGASVESCTFENLTVGVMSGFDGPGLMNASNLSFKKCGYCLLLGTILLPWWNSNIWQIQPPGNWTVANNILRTITMESFAIGGFMAAGGANTIQGLQIISDGSLAVPRFGMGGPGGTNAYRNVTITGTYSGAALDLFNTHTSIFDGIDVSNSGSGVAYTQPWQGTNVFRNNNIGFNPAKPLSALPTGGDIGPFPYMKSLVSDSVDAAFSGTSNVGKPISGGGSHLVEARFDPVSTQWVIAG